MPIELQTEALRPTDDATRDPDKVQSLQAAISGDAAKQAAELTDQMNIVRRVLRRVAFAIGGAVAPMLIDLAKKTSKAVSTAINWVQNNKQLTVTAFKAERPRRQQNLPHAGFHLQALR